MRRKPTKKELIEAIKEIDPNGVGKRAKMSLRRDVLVGMIELARRGVAATKKKAEKERARAEREELWKENFDGVKYPPQCVVTETPEEFKALDAATYRLKNALYWYNELAREIIQYRSLVEELTQAWEAFRDGTVFPNGLQVTAEDIDRLLGLIRVWTQHPMRLHTI